MIGKIVTFPALTPIKLVEIKGQVVEISNGIIFVLVTESQEGTGIKEGEKVGISPMQVVKVEEGRQ